MLDWLHITDTEPTPLKLPAKVNTGINPVTTIINWPIEKSPWVKQIKSKVGQMDFTIISHGKFCQ